MHASGSLDVQVPQFLVWSTSHGWCPGVCMCVSICVSLAGLSLCTCNSQSGYLCTCMRIAAEARQVPHAAPATPDVPKSLQAPSLRVLMTCTAGSALKPIPMATSIWYSYALYRTTTAMALLHTECVYGCLPASYKNACRNCLPVSKEHSACLLARLQALCVCLLTCLQALWVCVSPPASTKHHACLLTHLQARCVCVCVCVCVCSLTRLRALWVLALPPPQSTVCVSLPASKHCVYVCSPASTRHCAPPLPVVLALPGASTAALLLPMSACSCPMAWWAACIAAGPCKEG